MSEKLISQLATHVTPEAADQIRALSDLAGRSSSEYLRELIMSHLDEKRRQFQSMQQIFSTPGTDGAERTDT
jgi:predicted DNA-binding protein